MSSWRGSRILFYILIKCLRTHCVTVRGMHLLEGGVNLVYIRDFLGHSSITTTEIYARANPEIKKKGNRRSICIHTSERKI